MILSKHIEVHTPHDTGQADQLPHSPKLFEHCVLSQVVQVALWLSESSAPLQLFSDPRVRERVLVPLVVHEPWQAP